MNAPHCRYALRTLAVGGISWVVAAWTLVLAASLALLPAMAHAASSAAPAGRLESPRLTIGLAQHATSFLPLYLAEEHTFREERLTVEALTFTSGARLAQALASDSVDIAIASLNVVMSMINAGQPVKAFYAGISLADFEWFASPAILGWNGLRGKNIAISTYGSLTDFLTRHVLRKHGLRPEREVQLVQVGEPANLFSALRARRVDAAILLPPFKWQAERLGFTRLGTQAAEVAEEWPRLVFIAKEKFLQDQPDKARAVLRAHVRAIRQLQHDGGAAVQAIMRRLKYDRVSAERAYAEARGGFDERGRLPAKAMSVFWESAIAEGEAEAPWPDSRYLDRRFMDTFDAWAPK